MRTPLALAIAAPLALMPHAVLAQDVATDAPAAEVPAASFDDATLQAFANAIVAIEDVRADYEPQLAAATEADRAILIEEANVAMLAAVEETGGITLEQYLAVNDAAGQDPDLAEKIVALLPDDLRSLDAAPQD